jgi:hypothetical protein
MISVLDKAAVVIPGFRSTPAAVGRIGAALLVFAASAVFVDSAAAVPEPTLPGEAYGPGVVHPGKLVHFWGRDLRPSQKVVVIVQPLSCVGSNGCGAGVRGHWRSSKREGAVHVAFRFPRRYGLACTAAGCAEHPGFELGTEAQVQLCVRGPAGNAHYGYACVVKDVEIGIAAPSSSRGS